MEEKIKEILENSFECVYCDTCAEYCNEDVCDYCHRKNMNWGISEDYAKIVAQKIIREIFKEQA